MTIKQSCRCDDMYCPHDCIVQVDLSHDDVSVQYSVLNQRDKMVIGGCKVSNCL